MQKQFEGQAVTVTRVNGGWSTIHFEGKSLLRKVRNGQLSDPPVPARKATRKADEVKMIRIKDALVRADSFTTHDVQTESGRKSTDCNDNLADKLRGMTLDAVYVYAAPILEMTVAELRNKYAHLNPGMQRMCLGNRMRGAL